jgi:hypothetical protein
MPFVQGSAIEKAKSGSLEGRLGNIAGLIQAEYPDVSLNIVATFEDHVLAFNDEGQLRKIGYDISEDGALVVKSDRPSRAIPVISDAEVPSHVARELKSISKKMMEGKSVPRTQVRELSAMIDPDEDYWMTDILSKIDESTGDSEWYKMYDANMEKVRTSLYGRVRELEGKAPRTYYSKIPSDRLGEFDSDLQESMSILHGLFQGFCERCSGFSFDEKQDFLSAVRESLIAEAQAVVGLLGKAAKLKGKDNLALVAKAHDKLADRARIMALTSEYLASRAMASANKE